MKKHTSNLTLWERERRRERLVGYIVTGVLAFFAVMAFSQDALACDILGCVLLFAAGCCLFR